MAEGIYEASEANLLYKVNRSQPDITSMVKMVEGSHPQAAICLARFIQSMHSRPTKRRVFMELMEFLADGMCGVEYMGEHKNGYDVLYLNAGDIYSTTLIFHNHNDGTVRIGCIADAMNQVRTAESF